jgi:hypothetical protein
VDATGWRSKHAEGEAVNPETTEHVLMLLRLELRALEDSNQDEMRRVATATREEIIEIEARVTANNERAKEIFRRIARLQK